MTEPTSDVAFARRLNVFLRTRSHLLPRLCELADVTPERVANWQRGEDLSSITAQQLGILCRLSGLSADWFLGFSGSDDEPSQLVIGESEFTFGEEATSAVASMIRRFTRAIEGAEIAPRQKFALMHGLLHTKPLSSHVQEVEPIVVSPTESVRDGSENSTDSENES